MVGERSRFFVANESDDQHPAPCTDTRRHSTSMKKKTPAALDPYGSEMTYTEPNHLQGFASPYYTASHLAWRKRVRDFMETHVLPVTSDPHSEVFQSWKANGYPKELHVKLYEAGIGGALWDAKYGGTRFPEWDYFHEMILFEEIFRNANPHVLGQLAINSMAIPPIIHYGSDYLKDLVLPGVIQGTKHCALAISEPTAGSDVANIKTTAVREGDYYIVNGSKKWISFRMLHHSLRYPARLTPSTPASLHYRRAPCRLLHHRGAHGRARRRGTVHVAHHQGDAGDQDPQDADDV